MQGGIYSFLVLILSLILGINAQANLDRTSYMNAVGTTLAIAQERAFEKATQTLLQKYCPSQYERIASALQTIVKNRRSVSWAYLKDLEESWMPETFAACPNRGQVEDLLQGFNEKVAETANTIGTQIAAFIDNEAHEVSQEEVQRKADALLQMLVDLHLNPRQLLAQVEAGEEDDSYSRAMRLFAGSAKAGMSEEGEFPSRPVKQDATCTKCNKRVLVPMHCDCGGTFCINHRHPESHLCTFDHRAAGRKKLARDNPKVVGSQLEQI